MLKANYKLIFPKTFLFPFLIYLLAIELKNEQGILTRSVFTSWGAGSANILGGDIRKLSAPRVVAESN